ncbi:hypothetical protein SAMN05443144_11442 [Fodinibius roseus]|uniref:Uncharacterized protein n=1 Tax=Fodinibius roseus TaxID=1194090 RepID=A0A1M5F2I9_9BACT|nr:hypothetical protein SAMN05443144_11442 [Fodinibius roseus]
MDVIRIGFRFMWIHSWQWTYLQHYLLSRCASFPSSKKKRLASRVCFLVKNPGLIVRMIMPYGG